MKRFIIGLIYTIAVATALSHISGCQSVDEAVRAYSEPEQQTEVPGASENAATDTPVPTVTNTPVPTATNTPVPTATNTPVPTATNTPVPTATNTPVPAATKPAAPTATNTPAPTATYTAAPTKIARPTHTPMPTLPDDRKDVGDLVKKLPVRSNVIMNTTDSTGTNIMMESAEDACRFIMETCGPYSSISFAVLYKDASCIHSVDYYLAKYPELGHMEVDYGYSAVYHNGILVSYYVEPVGCADLAYALRSDDMSMLSGEQLVAVGIAKDVSEELGLSEMSEIEVIKTVHDHIIDNTRYDTTYADVSHTAYGLMRYNTAVCDGYSEAFMIYMLLNGIECNRISGVAENEAHAWNQVCVDGKWYNIDLTFDDPLVTDAKGRYVDKRTYDWFMLDDSMFYENHMPDSLAVKRCSSQEFILYPYEGYVAGDKNEIADVIASQKGNETIRIVYPTGSGITEDTCKNAFRDYYKGAFSFYNAVEIRKGWKMFEIVNPGF